MVKNTVEKSFVVMDGDLRLLLEYEAGWYTVSSLDIRGLNTQGRTIEEAIENAHAAAKLLAEDRAEVMSTALPRHKEIGPGLVRKICGDLNIPVPPEK